MSNQTAIAARDTKVASFTGVTGSGKSFKARDVAKGLSKVVDRVLVITYAGAGDTWDDCQKIAPTEKDLKFKKGWKKINFVEHEDECNPLEEVYKHYRNGVLILDDCSMYLSASWAATPGLKMTLIDHRFNGIDILFIAHSPVHIPKQCWAYIKFSWIFKCTSQLKKDDMPIDNFQKFLTVQNEINRKFDEEEKRIKEKPRGIYSYITI